MNKLVKRFGPMAEIQEQWLRKIISRYGAYRVTVEGLPSGSGPGEADPAEVLVSREIPAEEMTDFVCGILSRYGCDTDEGEASGDVVLMKKIFNRI